MNLLERDNNSGLGVGSDVPEELKKWNWGAFLLGWVWGLGHSSYKTFRVFIPLVGFIFIFINGSKGSEWAWQNRKWDSIEHFKRVQRKWKKAGLIVFGCLIALMISVFFLVMGILKNSEAVKLSTNNISQTEVFQRQVGAPFEIGFVSGEIQTSNSNGFAEVQYTITGPNGEVEVYAIAHKVLDEWKITCQVVKYKSMATQITIVPCQ